MDFYPVPGYSLFSATLRPATPFVVAGEMTTLQVTPQLSFAPSLLKPVNGQIVFSVKKRLRPLLVETLTVTNNQAGAATYTVPVTKGDWTSSTPPRKMSFTPGCTISPTPTPGCRLPKRWLRHRKSLRAWGTASKFTMPTDLTK